MFSFVELDLAGQLSQPTIAVHKNSFQERELDRTKKREEEKAQEKGLDKK